LLTLDPTLRDRSVIFLVDGDKGRIAAIRSLLPNARVYLCLWHKEENVKKHINPALNARRKLSGNMTCKELKEELAKRGIKYSSCRNLLLPKVTKSRRWLAAMMS